LKVACGLSLFALIDRQGALHTWGSGLSGQLGHGHTRSVPRPTKVAALAGESVVHVAVGHYSCMAVSLSGSLYSWGLDGQGKGCLGHGPGIAEVWEPLAVAHLKGVHIEEACFGHNKREAFALARSAQGVVYAWGGVDIEGETGATSGVVMGHGPGVTRLDLPTEVAKLTHFEKYGARAPR